MNQVLSIEEIKEQFPNEWVLLGNPIIENTKILSGIPLFHAKNKKEIADKHIEWRSKYTLATTIYTGDFPKNRRFWL